MREEEFRILKRRAMSGVSIDDQLSVRDVERVVSVIIARAKRSEIHPLTLKQTNDAIVRSTMSFAREMIIDWRVKRPNQCLCRQWFRSMPSVRAVLTTSFSGGNTDAYPLP
jgi:hypothetical protein